MLPLSQAYITDPVLSTSLHMDYSASLPDDTGPNNCLSAVLRRALQQPLYQVCIGSHAVPLSGLYRTECCLSARTKEDPILPFCQAISLPCCLCQNSRGLQAPLSLITRGPMLPLC